MRPTIIKKAQTFATSHGLDGTFAVNLATRMWTLAFGPVLLGVLVYRLTLAEQGFYYTFISLIGLSVFLDMGFSRAIQVFTSHEFANLRLTKGRPMEGEARHLSRMADFGKAVLLAHLLLALVAGGLIGAMGEVMFRREDAAGIAWRGPWWNLSFAAAASFLILPMTTMLEAAGHVRHMAWVKLARQVAAGMALLSALLGGMGLGASAISAWIGFALAMGLVAIPFRAFWEQLCGGNARRGFGLLRELAGYQVRIAVGWAAGYFIFSIMTPIAFAAIGAEDAAKVGLTWQIMGIVSSIAFSVIQAKTPGLGSLIGKGRADEALEINRRATRGALAIAAAGYALILLGMWAVRSSDSSLWPAFVTDIVDRMLPALPVALLAVAEIAKLQMLGLMSFVRSLKVEPFMPMLVTLAILVPAACWALASRFGVEWLCMGYVAGQLVANPWTNRTSAPFIGEIRSRNSVSPSP